jgi:hypothetical protein
VEKVLKQHAKQEKKQKLPRLPGGIKQKPKRDITSWKERRFIVTKVYQITPGCSDIDQEALNKVFEGFLEESFLYARLKSDGGNLVVDTRTLTSEAEKKLTESTHSIGDVEYRVEEMKDPFFFWAKHSEHFNRLLFPIFKNRAEIFKKGCKGENSNGYNLAGVRFNSFNKIKKMFQVVLASQAVGTRLEEILSAIVVLGSDLLDA